MNSTKHLYKFKVEIRYSRWAPDKRTYYLPQTFEKICIDEEDQTTTIVKFQREHDVLIWWIMKWKTRISLSDWFE